MAIVQVIGCDPALSNLGLVKGNLDLSTLEFTPTETLLIKTKPDNTKGIRKNEDDLRRCKELYNGFAEFAKGVDIIFIEMPVGSQSARAMASYGMCIGLFSSVADGSLFLTQAKLGKFYLTGDPNASKAKMISEATEIFPDLNWITNVRKGVSVLSPENEHVADAIGSVLAGINSTQFKSLLTSLRILRNV